MNTYDELCDLIRSDNHIMCGQGASEAQIRSIEERLDLTLPMSYARFLRDFGWIHGPFECVHGVGDDVPSNLEVVFVTTSEREIQGLELRPGLVAVCPDGMGNHYCLDTGKMVDGECPVVFWDHEDPDGGQQEPEVEAASFAEWLLEEFKSR